MGTNTNADLAEVLFGRTKRTLLALLFANPGRPLYLRELTRLSAGGHGGVQRELSSLVKSGVILRRRGGRHVYFEANRECPIFPEIQQMLVKTAGLGDELRKALKPLFPRIQVAFIFGSFAKGEYKPGSDVDLLVIGEVSFEEVARAIAAAERTLAREINPVVYPLPEFTTKFRAGQSFLREVVAGAKVFIVGDDRELEGMVAKWLAR